MRQRLHSRAASPSSHALQSAHLHQLRHPFLRNCNFGIWTTDTTGADLRLLLGDLNYPDATVSPDGRTVLFENWWTLYLVDAAGQHKHPLLTGLTRNVTPSWSPDGHWIYFEATDTSLYQIYRIHPDGTGRERVTSNVGIHERGPALSRDGRQLAYVAVDSFQVHEWAVIRDLASGAERVLTDSTFSGLSPEWSPDASTLLFVGPDTSGIPTDWALWRLNTLTLAYTYFANAHGNRTARYSPDGRSLVYGTGDLRVADSDGQHSRVSPGRLHASFRCELDAKLATVICSGLTSACTSRGAAVGLLQAGTPFR